MRVIVFGAGAIGGVIAARLALAGTEATVVARGPHLAVIREHGIAFEAPEGGRQVVRLEAGDGATRPGDVVLVTLKSYALPGAAEAIARLVAPGGCAVFLQNGLPWWYFRDIEGPFRDRALPTLDPGGVLASAIPQDALAGGVVSISATLPVPGEVRHTGGTAMAFGRPDGRADARLDALAEALRRAGLDASLPGDPRPAIWTKLAVNIGLNGVAALTGASLGDIWNDPHLPALVARLVAEAEALAAALGCPVHVDLEQRRRAAVGHHRSSTLQDLETGRPIEHEALFGALLPIAWELGVAVPHIEAISALLRRRALEAGCLPSAQSGAGMMKQPGGGEAP